MTEETNNYENIDGMTWEQVIDDYNLEGKRFLHIYNLHPDMLTEQGHSRNVKNGQKKIEGDVIFGKEFVIRKIKFLFEQLNCYDGLKIDELIGDVKAQLENDKKQIEQDKIDKINALAKELGLTKKELTKKL